MDRLSNLTPAKGSTKNKKRVGRGEGSGHGGQSTRGMNGQLSRSGSKQRAWFEGGQMPLQRRVPKYGFTSPFKVHFQVINVDQLQALADKLGASVELFDAKVFYKNGLISSGVRPYKILGNGQLKSKINVEAAAFSKSAKEKIEAAGGTTNVVTI
ncbi:MAG: 50S ribosomal protein L15 [Ignavibacteriales bacterium]